MLLRERHVISDMPDNLCSPDLDGFTKWPTVSRVCACSPVSFSLQDDDQAPVHVQFDILDTYVTRLDQGQIW